MKISNLFLSIAVVALLACGNSKSSDNSASAQENQKPVEAVQNKDGLSIITIEGNDQMRFNLDEIKVKEGDLVELTLKHVGELDVKIMGHNFVLLKPGTDINDFAKKAMKAKDNDYIPVDSPNVIVHTKMIGGGEETSITFDAPAPGTYEFVCSFPGHVALMNGKFIVE